MSDSKLIVPDGYELIPECDRTGEKPEGYLYKKGYCDWDDQIKSSCNTQWSDNCEYARPIVTPKKPTQKPAKRQHCGFDHKGKHYDAQGIDGVDATKYDQETAEIVARRDALTADIRVRRRDVLRLAKWADETKGWK